MTQRDDNALISTLVDDLQPVAVRWPALRVGAIWLVLSVAYVLGAMALLGPFREGAGTQLLTHPRFAAEMMVGVLAVICFIMVAIRQAVPGQSTRPLQYVALGLGAIWLFNFVAGIHFPTLEPSMHGKREFCAWESYVYSAPPALFAVVLLVRRFPLQPLASGINAGVAAGLIPAVTMQIACMYEPVHILEHHAAPIAVVALVTGVAAFMVNRHRHSHTRSDPLG